MAEQRYCPKCRKTMADVNFYQYKDGTKCELCKSCLTMHINTYDPPSFLWMLEKFDVPYVEGQWIQKREKEFEKALTKARASGSADPESAAYEMTKGNGAVFGKYLSGMKLRPWNEKCWADTERMRLEAEEKAKLHGNTNEDMEKLIEEKKVAFEKGEINEAEYLTYKNLNVEEQEQKSLERRFLESDAAASPSNSPYPVNDNPFERVDIPTVELTNEEKLFYATKWGRLYSAEDWVWLEKKYDGFMKSFDIQGEARIDTLVMICKTSLKMNQALDSGDIDSYQKLSRVYDAMMKAAKFTEAQRKEEKSGEFDAVGQICWFAEKHGGKIDRYKTDEPLDIYDEALNKLKKYNKDLFMNDPSLSQQLENYIRRRENLELEKQLKEQAEAEGEEYLEVEDSDYEEFNELLEQEREEDDI